MGLPTQAWVGLLAPQQPIDRAAFLLGRPAAAAVAVLEIPPAFAARGPIPALAIRAFAATALTLLRTSFAVRPLAFGSIAPMARAADRAFGFRFSDGGRRNRGRLGRSCRLRAI